MLKTCLFLGKLDTGQKKFIFSNAEEKKISHGFIHHVVKCAFWEIPGGLVVRVNSCCIELFERATLKMTTLEELW